MIIKRIIVLCMLGFAISAYCAERCPSNTLAKSKSIQHKQTTALQATNMTEVAWQILSSLERSIDVRCAVLVVSFRRLDRGPINKEDCKLRLRNAELGAAVFQSEMSDMFCYAFALQQEREASSEILKEIASAAKIPQDRLMVTYRQMFRPFLTSPPTPDREEFDRQESKEVRDLMSIEEKYRYMLLYAHFKTILASTFVRYLTQDLKMDEKGTVKILWEEEKPIRASDDEVNFLLSVITNQTLKVKSDITPLP